MKANWLMIKAIAAWLWGETCTRASWMIARIYCAFDGHGPETYEIRRARWPAECDVSTFCADCGTKIGERRISSEIRR